MRKRVMVVYGTRPEAIKVAPLILALQANDKFDTHVVITGQHTNILRQVNELFGITPDRNLKIMRPEQPLNELSARLLTELDPVLVEMAPDALVVQGDTSSVSAAAMASFYREIPVIHLEAGLRSGNLFDPFPEEGNRRITGQLASLHLAPTSSAKDNLIREAIDETTIAVTGNTVVDALLYAVRQPINWNDANIATIVESDSPIILVTTHRRENWGNPMANSARAIAQVAREYPDYQIILPMHPNPVVRSVLTKELDGIANIVLTEPLEYLSFSHLIKRSHLVVTDSGGLQEEAPALGKPVLVLRKNTERPEAIEAGTVKLIGTDTDRVHSEICTLLDDKNVYRQMAHAVNPYGDGQAGQRSVAAIEEFFGVGKRLPDFKDNS